MIEIGRFIHQFDIGEADEKSKNCKSIFITEGNTNGRNSTNYEDKIGPISQRLNPFKAIVGKEKSRFYVKFINPPVSRETDKTN